MPEHDPTAYGDKVADRYDALYGDSAGTGAAVDRLAALAGDGPVLELGIGTGRLAIPLMERGLEVHGIEASQEMVRALAQNAGAAEIPVWLGDFVSTTTEHRYPLAVLAFNTIFAPASQQEQVRCFANVAAHLKPGGRFVVEAYVLTAGDLAPGWHMRPRTVQDDAVELQIGSYDGAEQRMSRVLVHLSDGGVNVHAATDRYASPGELDLMAELAGLRREARWAGWSGETFTAASDRHVSVYERP